MHTAYKKWSHTGNLFPLRQLFCTEAAIDLPQTKVTWNSPALLFSLPNFAYT